MAYKALYRIYRPQTFDEVVGQSSIVTTLQNALKHDKISHAYLFTGPRGTGKTTIARLLAKALNCTSTTKDHPCDECPNCLAISNGTHPDVIEIDAASNTQAVDARELIEKVKFSPIEGKYKIYIIDEVHMMSPGAFNVLLKTLEEPPAHVVFVLATTDVQKVLPTIISRCQRFDFTKITKQDMINKLKEILDKEKATYEEEALTLVAELSDGGVRDALSILDQALVYGNNNLTAETVRDVYGVISNEDAVQFILDISHKDTSTCLNKINEFDQKGMDLARFTSNLIKILKETIVYNNTQSYKGEINKEILLPLCKELLTTEAFNYIDILVQAKTSYRDVTSPRSYFELAILKMLELGKNETPKVKEVIKEVVVEKPVEVIKEVIVEKPVEIVKEVKEEVKEETIVEKISEPVVEDIVEPQEEIKEEVQPSITTKHLVMEFTQEDIMNVLVQATKVDNEKAKARWKLIRSYISNATFGKGAQLLYDAQVVAASSNAVVIAYMDKPQAKAIYEKENYDEVHKLLTEILGHETACYPLTDDEFKRYKLVFIDNKMKNTLPIPNDDVEPRFIEKDLDKKMVVQNNDTILSKEEHQEVVDDVVSNGRNIFGAMFKEDK